MACDLEWAWKSFISYWAFQMQVIYICVAIYKISTGTPASCGPSVTARLLVRKKHHVQIIAQVKLFKCRPGLLHRRRWWCHVHLGNSWMLLCETSPALLCPTTQQNTNNSYNTTRAESCIIHLCTRIYTEPKKRGNTSVIITGKTHKSIFIFLHCCKQEQTFYTHMKNMTTSPK